MRRDAYTIPFDEDHFDQVDYLANEMFWPIINDLSKLGGEFPALNWLLSMIAIKAFSEGCQHPYTIPDGATWPSLRSSQGDIVSRMNAAFEIMEEANPELEGVFTFNNKTPLSANLLHQCIQKLNQKEFDTRVCSNPVTAYSPLAMAIEEILWRCFQNDPDCYTDLEIAFLQTRVLELDVRYEEIYDPELEVRKIYDPELNVKYDAIYDPAAGVGVSLLACAKSLRNESVRIEGQELDEGSRTCAMLNLILHGFYNSQIKLGDVITQPQWLDTGGIKKYQVIVTDLSSGIGSWDREFAVSDPYGRFSIGIPGVQNSDMALLIHCLASLDNDGKAAVIVQPGILYRGGNEAQIRKNLIKQDIIESVITLPSQLYLGQTFQPAIIVFNRNKAPASKGIIKFIYGAEEYVDHPPGRSMDEGFISDWDNMEDISAEVSLQEVAANDFNLNPRLYLSEMDVWETKAGDGIVRPRMYLKDITPSKVALSAISEIWRGMNPKNEQRPTRGRPAVQIAGGGRRSQLAKIINLSNVQDGRLMEEGLEQIHLTEKESVRARRYKMQKDDIIVACRGTVVKVAIIPETDPWEYYLSNNFICVRPQKGYDPVYLKAFLESPLGVFFLEASRYGATVQSMTVEHLGKIMVPNLPIREQRKIAQQLSDTEAAYTEALKKAEKDYIEGYQTLYRQMKIDCFFEPFEI